jgi:hypothetical protein
MYDEYDEQDDHTFEYDEDYDDLRLTMANPTTNILAMLKRD